MKLKPSLHKNTKTNEENGQGLIGRQIFKIVTNKGEHPPKQASLMILRNTK